MTTAPSPTTTEGVGFRSERGPVLGALMLTTGLVALDSTIIATAVPSIVQDVGGFTQFPWLFSIYLLTAAVSVPLYGKLADVIGRKPLLFFGIAVFLLGSILCGLAWSMPALIAFRAVQGIGAGAIQPISMTVVGDLYSVAERARVQGYLASVWGASSVIGPTLGGVFAQYLSWRWIFFVNIPLGAVAAWMLLRHFSEKVTRRSHRLDYTGAGLLTVGCSLVILGLLEGGVSWAWGSAQSLVIFGVGAVLLLALLAGGAARPGAGPAAVGLHPPHPRRRQPHRGGRRRADHRAQLLRADVRAGRPRDGRARGRLRARRADGRLAAGSDVLRPDLHPDRLSRHGAHRGGGRPGRHAACTRLGPTAQVWQVAGACFVVGVGLGFLSSPVVVAVQSVVGWDRRGVVTGTNMFSRSIGSALGAAVFGAVANATLASRLAHAPRAVAGSLPDDATSLVMSGHASRAHDAATEFVRAALYAASHAVFVGLVAVAVLAVVALMLMPRRTEPLTFD